jgi:hypothetical protein
MLTEWEDLLNSLNLTGLACVSSEQEISEFEEKCGFKVPESYKNYCRIFGHGTFKDKDLAIYEIGPISWIDAVILESFSIREAQFTDDELPLAIHLKDHGFYIGIAEDICFFWDLGSCQSSDDEYDIYARTESDNGLYKVGRNFFQFIRDFCIGQVGTRDFPGLIFLPTDENNNPLNTNEFTRPAMTRKEIYGTGDGKGY